MNPEKLSHRITRETFVEIDDFALKQCPVGSFDSLLNPDEDLLSVSGNDISDRINNCLEPYTDKGDDSHPTIEIINFGIDTDEFDRIIIQNGSVTIRTPMIRGKRLVSIKNALDENTVSKHFGTYVKELQELNSRLLTTTFRLSDIPSTIIWKEAFPSQFVFIPPEEDVFIDGVKKNGGKLGTFILVDLDPRFISRPNIFNSDEFKQFEEDLDIQLLWLSGEVSKLYGVSENYGLYERINGEKIPKKFFMSSGILKDVVGI